MRGALYARDWLLTMFGIIPAYAGSTVWMMMWICSLGDHPRVCGEHPIPTPGFERNRGSSPRMRGARCDHAKMKYSGRIIPAYAGSTNIQSLTSNDSEDHPRVCGEHGCSSFELHRAGGSSPRMRGALCLFHIRFGPPGIIPAYAGSTGTARPARLAGEDHPRVCGEHFSDALFPTFRAGSSPRMRGAPFHDNGIRFFGGIIPAYAGSTMLLHG